MRASHTSEAEAIAEAEAGWQATQANPDLAIHSVGYARSRREYGAVTKQLVTLEKGYVMFNVTVAGDKTTKTWVLDEPNAGMVERLLTSVAGDAVVEDVQSDEDKFSEFLDAVCSDESFDERSFEFNDKFEFTFELPWDSQGLVGFKIESGVAIPVYENEQAERLFDDGEGIDEDELTVEVGGDTIYLGYNLKDLVELSGKTEDVYDAFFTSVSDEYKVVGHTHVETFDYEYDLSVTLESLGH